MTLRNEFNEYLADAYCHALLAGDTSQGQSLLALDDRLPSFLIEKFCDALDKNNIKLVTALYKTGLIDINGFNSNGDTPLIHALRHKTVNAATFSALLSFTELDVNKKSNCGDPAILFATHPKNIQRLYHLLRHPALDVNATNKNGFTALMESARYEDIHIVSELLKHPDIDVNARNNRGMTAFMMMVSFEESRIVDRMLAVPALDILAKDNDGRTAAGYAYNWGNIECGNKVKSFEIN